jgi:hypothetical protein
VLGFTHCLVSFEEDHTAAFVSSGKIIAGLIELYSRDDIRYARAVSRALHSTSSMWELNEAMVGTFCYVFNVSFVTKTSTRVSYMWISQSTARRWEEQMEPCPTASRKRNVEADVLCELPRRGVALLL